MTLSKEEEEEEGPTPSLCPTCYKFGGCPLSFVCLEIVWKVPVSGGCLEGVWRVSMGYPNGLWGCLDVSEGYVGTGQVMTG